MPTLSTSEYPPFLLARLVNSLDHVTEGRVGWNCVTSSNDGAAQNYGQDGQRAHDERYELSDEFADLVTKLWDAWEPDAVMLDRETPMFADGSKVHAVNHDGKYFKCRGPLNAPALAAGPAADLPGRRLAARAALRRPLGRHHHHRRQQRREHEGLSRGRAAHAVDAGRDPDGIKVLFLANPVIDSTMEAARDRRAAPAGRRGEAPGHAARQHVAPDQHRLLAVRPGRAPAGR